MPSRPPEHRFAVAIVGLLLAASLVCLALLGFRMWYSRGVHYWFLAWNLFLAWVPLVVAGIAYELSRQRKASALVVVAVSAVVWLVFFPNAPYILTDFLHLGSMGDIIPGWYDVLMLFWFAWTGLLLGVVSLYLMHDLARRRFGAAAGWTFVALAAFLGSLGIYVGRFLRWNSWDVLRRPGSLAGELLGRATDPANQPRFLGFTLVVALLFLCIYVAVYIFATFTHQPRGVEASVRVARRREPEGAEPRPRQAPR